MSSTLLFIAIDCHVTAMNINSSKAYRKENKSLLKWQFQCLVESSVQAGAPVGGSILLGEDSVLCLAGGQWCCDVCKLVFRLSSKAFTKSFNSERQRQKYNGKSSAYAQLLLLQCQFALNLLLDRQAG